MHTLTRKFFLTLLTLTATCTGVGALAILAPTQSAQAEGFVLFGPGRDSTLGYSIRNGRPSARGEYLRLFIPAQDVAATELQLNYPEAYNQYLRPDLVRILNQRTRQEIRVQQATNDPSTGSIRFAFAEPVPSGVPLELRITGLTNPSSPGMYRLQARLLGTEANPLFRYVGQWLVTISR